MQLYILGSFQITKIMDQKLAAFLRGNQVKEAVNTLLLLSDVKKKDIPKFIQTNKVTLRLAW